MRSRASGSGKTNRTEMKVGSWLPSCLHLGRRTGKFHSAKAVPCHMPHKKQSRRHQNGKVFS